MRSEITRNKHGNNTAIILFAQCLRYLSHFSSQLKTQCIDAFTLLLQRHVRKGSNAKNPKMPAFSLLLKEPS